MGACGARGRVVTARKAAEEEPKGPKEELLLFYTSVQSAIAPRVKALYNEVLEKDTENVDTLNLQFSQLGAVQVPYFTRVLQFYPHLRIVKLWKAKLTAEGARLLSPSLATLDCLESLGLEDNQLQDDGITAISEALTSLTRLRELFVQVNSFAEVGATALSKALAGKTALEVLNLSENRLGGYGLKVVLQACAGSLKVLELAHAELGRRGGEVLLEEWGSFTHLERLRVSGNGFGDDLERVLLQKSPQVHVLI